MVTKMDVKNLEIRSKSVEQTLMPLMSQISALINHKSAKFKRSNRALKSVCSKLHEAVLQFVTVGEEIADENPEFSSDLLNACGEAKDAVTTLSDAPVNEGDSDGEKRASIVRAARSLLASVTRVIIINDMVAVKALISAARKVDERLSALESVNSFTEFVQAFSHFGADMVRLARLSGERQNDLKDDISKAEMCAARTLLEKSTMLLLTTSKTFLRHPESTSAKENREGVFLKMRSAMDTITAVAQNNAKKRKHTKGQLVLHIKKFDYLFETNKINVDDDVLKAKLQEGLALILEDVRTIAYAPNTKPEKREGMLALCDNAEDIMNDLKNEELSEEKQDLSLQRIYKLTKDLKNEVHQVASDQVFETFSHLGHKKSLPALRAAASTGNGARVDELAEVFLRDVKKLLEVSKMTRALCSSEAIAITAEKVEENILTFCPHVIEAGRTLALHPVSKIAQENCSVFIDIWESQVEELGKLLRSIISGGDLRRHDDMNLAIEALPSRIDQMLKQGLKSESPVTSDSEDENELSSKQSFKEQEKLARIIDEIDSLTMFSDFNARDIDSVHEKLMRRAKEMSGTAMTMDSFIHGLGKIHLSEELFFEAQRFSELGRKFHKLSAQFLVQLPDLLPKKHVMSYIDRLPGYCEQLNFASKSFAVGQCATYIKAGSAIHLTRNILKLVARILKFLLNSSIEVSDERTLHSRSSISELSQDSISSLSLTPLASSFIPEPPGNVSDSDFDFTHD